jgi:hypothetical protein
MMYPVYAQETSKETPEIYTKGRLMLGLSNLDFYHSRTIKDGDGNIVGGNLTLGADLRAGFFVKDRWMLSLNLGYSFNSPKRNEQVNLNVLNFTAFSRHYFPISKKLSFFTEVNAGYIHTFLSNSSNTWASNGGLALGADAGLAYRMGKNFSLEASTGYRLNLINRSTNLVGTNPKLGINFHF